MNKDTRCPQCGARQRPGAVYCAKCGAPMLDAPAKASAPLSAARQGRAQKRNLLMPILIAGALLVLAGGILLAVSQDRASQAISPTQAVSQLPDEHGEGGLPYPEVARVPIAEAKTRVENAGAILVDVRSQGEYDTAHAQGARLLSLANLEARYRELPQNAEIITYCT